MTYEVTIDNPLSSPDTVIASSISPCEPLHHPCYATANPMAIQIIRGERFDLRDDSSAFAILDSMRDGRDPVVREFYFWLVTRSMKHSDGYFSEGISRWGYELYDSLPCEFLSHFVHLECLGEEDLTNWGHYLGFEFFLEEDDIESGKLARAQAWIRNECRSCAEAEKQVAERICSTVKADVDAMHRDP